MSPSQQINCNSALKPSQSRLERMHRYWSGFCAHVSDPETRNIPWHMLQLWQARIEYGESQYILGQCRPPDPFMLYIVFCWLALHTDRQMHMHSNAQMHKCTCSSPGKRLIWWPVCNMQRIFLHSDNLRVNAQVRSTFSVKVNNAKKNIGNVNVNFKM